VVSRLSGGEATAMTAVFSTIAAADTIKALDEARDRLDRATDLLIQALDLRERLWFGADLDLMVDEVQAFKRACDAYRRLLT